MTRFKDKESRSASRNRNQAKKWPELVNTQKDVDAHLEYEVNKVRFKAFEPRNEAQARYAEAINNKRIIFATGCACTGKAQPLDAMVKVPGGWSMMGDLEVGSEITAPDGSVTEVTEIHPQGRKEIFKVTFEDGRSTECCMDHLWKVYKNDWMPYEARWRVVPLSDIIRLMGLRSNLGRLYVPLIDPEESVEIPLPVSPYSLGALIGDGFLGQSSVRLSSADQFIVDKFSELLPEGLSIVNRKGFDYAIVKTWGNAAPKGRNPLLDSIRDLGLDGKRSNAKFIPEQYMFASTAQKIELLQGLMDTDGTVEKGGAVSFCTVSQLLANQVRELIWSLGGLCKIATKRPSFTYKGVKKSGQLAYQLNIRIKNARRFFSLPRKIERISETAQYNDCLRLRIKSIEPVGVKPAQCISVGHPEHLYITDSYITTHNTYTATSIACEMLEAREIERIVIVRPMVGCEEDIGMLPGSLAEKFHPWLGPFFDVLE